MSSRALRSSVEWRNLPWRRVVHWRFGRYVHNGERWVRQLDWSKVDRQHDE